MVRIPMTFAGLGSSEGRQPWPSFSSRGLFSIARLAYSKVELLSAELKDRLSWDSVGMVRSSTPATNVEFRERFTLDFTSLLTISFASMWFLQ